MIRISFKTTTAIIVFLTVVFTSFPGLKTGGLHLHAAPLSGTAWALLGRKKQDEVLQTLANELETIRAGRAAQHLADKQSAKTLKQLLDELDKPDPTTLAGKYSQKYAIMALKAIASDAKKFAEIAGQSSAGDYEALKKELPRWGARIFANMVSDYLEETGAVQTKFVWTGLVARAGSLSQIGIKFMSGDVPGTLDLLKAQAISESESASKALVAQTLNWVFSETGIQPGTGYVIFIEKEVAFINWATGVFARSNAERCLQKYADKYRELEPNENKPYNNSTAEEAFKEFELCAGLAPAAAAFRQLSISFESAGIDSLYMQKKMAEAFRKNGTSPTMWLDEQVRAKKIRVESKFAMDLAKGQKAMSAKARLFSKALGVRFRALVEKALSKEELDELKKAAALAIAEAASDVNTIKRARDGVLALCAQYKSAKSDAVAARARWAKYADIAGRIHSTALDVNKCDAQDSPDLANALARVQTLASTFNSSMNDAKAGLEQTCKAGEGVKGATDKAAARELLEKARNMARKTEAAIKDGRSAHQSLADLVSKVSKPQAKTPNDRIIEIERIHFARIETQLGELAAIDGATIRAEFEAAKAAMQAAVRKSASLVNHATERKKKVHKLLDPHAASPMAKEIAAIFKEIDKAFDDMGGCTAVNEYDWGSGKLRAGSRGFSRERLNWAPDMAMLNEAIAGAKKRCPAAAGSLPSTPAVTGDPASQIAGLFKPVDAEIDLLTIAKQGYERCVANAIVDFSKTWLNKSPVATLRQSILIVLDASGSMGRKGRMPKALNAARRVLGAIKSGGDVEVGLIVFYGCGNIKIAAEFTTDPQKVIAVLSGIRPSGSTPLAAASAMGKRYLREKGLGANKRLIVLTDGQESCGGKPVAAMRN